jgi:hypothetical protein
MGRGQIETSARTREDEVENVIEHTTDIEVLSRFKENNHRSQIKKKNKTVKASLSKPKVKLSGTHLATRLTIFPTASKMYRFLTGCIP